MENFIIFLNSIIVLYNFYMQYRIVHIKVQLTKLSVMFFQNWTRNSFSRDYVVVKYKEYERCMNGHILQKTGKSIIVTLDIEQSTLAQILEQTICPSTYSICLYFIQ